MFDDTTGKLIRGASGTTLTSMVNAINGKADGAAGSTNREVAVFDGVSGLTLDGAGYTQTDVITTTQSNQYADVVEKASPVGADRLLLEDSAATFGKKYVQVSALASTPDLTDAVFPTYAVFDEEVVADATVAFADGNKQSVNATTYPNLTLTFPGVGNYVLRISNSGDLASITPTPLWDSGTGPSWSGTSILSLYRDQAGNIYGSAIVGAA